MLAIDNFLNEKSEMEALREYIWHCETNLPYTRPAPSLETPYFLGKHEETGYYFFYEPNKISVLDSDILFSIQSKCDCYVIHAHRCLLSPEYMKQYNIVFKEIPLQLGLITQKETSDVNLTSQRSVILANESRKG